MINCNFCRLPEDVRKEVMTRALNRTRSVLLPTELSTRKGYRSGWVSQEGSSRGIRTESNGRFSGGGRSDRWVFTKQPPFFSRALSVKSPRVAADGEGSTSVRTPRNGGSKLPSFKCLEPNTKDDETGLVLADSNKNPVREDELHQC
ncbi:uncharacterized protein LOC124919601 [Impatiens glandulifera]|uniref:uncharacterized protein LOC124919601 n=1 Tax=Impatiens glandulifera TaxID=253017 RepID=UPI001FB0C9B1|nr:uncharacterized protein LOC124919601 [Impatiens glandulifera]